MNAGDRRPIKTRSSAWALALATFLSRHGVSPNQISVASVVFAGLGAATLILYPSPAGLLLCAVAVQLRLLCNMLDGMVAVELGKQSALGHLYNELPDRVADVVLIVALGYHLQLPWLGWLGAAGSVATAYVRVLGGSLGLRQDFRGPMAKPHRMAVLTAACILGALERILTGTRYSLLVASLVIAAGSLFTCITRTRAIANRLRQNDS
jgi:phosphatidylglycerophosphate synthase